MKRVLIIKPSSIGDVIHTFPAVELMRQSIAEELRLTWVVNDSLRGVVELCSGIDRVVPFPRKGMWKLRNLRAFLKDLRKEQYDVVIDYQGLLKSGIMAWLSHAPIRYGFAHAREGAPFFYNRKCRIADMHTHAVDKNLALTALFLKEQFGIQDAIASYKCAIQSKAHSETPLVAVCFSSRWESKNWPVQFIAKVLDCVAAKRPDARIVLIGTQDDAALGDALMQCAQNAHLENLAGKTSFAELKQVLAEANVMYTVDSGPMHLAAACGTPCVAMFGATDHVLTGPYGPVGFHNVVCSKCGQSPCFKRQCPRNADCSENVSVEETAQLILDKLK